MTSSDMTNTKTNAAAAHKLSGLVSVVTPAHNAHRYIERVVRCVAEQTVAVLEHIVIDDGSTDATPTVLHELSRTHAHLLVLTQGRRGAAVSRNRGIDIARGRYIAFLDADDIWAPDKLERQISFMEQHGYLLSYGDYDEVDHYTLRPGRRFHFPQSVGHRDLLRGCPVGCLTVAYNQEHLGKRHMPEVRTAHDWGLWLALTRDGLRGHKYPGRAATYTHGGASLSRRKLQKLANIYRIYRSSEGLTPLVALFRTMEHAFVALAKKAKLIY